jgi:hypothetical protein
LQGVFQIGNLTLTGDASQLPAKLSTLGEASSPKRVAFADETARRINNYLAAVGVVATVDELAGLALLAQAQSFVGDQLVGTEAIV